MKGVQWCYRKARKRKPEKLLEHQRKTRAILADLGFEDYFVCDCLAVILHFPKEIFYKIWLCEIAEEEVFWLSASSGFPCCWTGKGYSKRSQDLVIAYPWSVGSVKNKTPKMADAQNTFYWYPHTRKNHWPLYPPFFTKATMEQLAQNRKLDG